MTDSNAGFNLIKELDSIIFKVDKIECTICGVKMFARNFHKHKYSQDHIQNKKEYDKKIKEREEYFTTNFYD
jgi:tmRNA-binding protein